jgi:hypothetical protein
MAITRVDIQNVSSDVLTLIPQDASNGYEVRDIQGLGPVKANLVSSSMAQVDGAQPESSRRDPRNITMTLGIKPNYILAHTVSSLRNDLYNYFMPKSVLFISFYMDNVLYAVTTATVEDFESPIFTDDPKADISLICYDPDFYAPTSTLIEGESTSDTSTTTINYPGTSPAGAVFTLSPDRDLTGFRIYNTKPDNTIQMFDFEGTILGGDVIAITSIPLQKSAIITRNMTPFSALYYVEAPFDWISFEKGGNDIRVFVADDPIPYTLEYIVKYGGL